MQLSSSRNIPNHIHTYIHHQPAPIHLSLVVGNSGESVLGDLDGIGVPGLALVGGGEAVGGGTAVQREGVAEVLVGGAEVDGEVVPA